MVGKTKQLELNKPTVRKMGQIKLPPRTESIVKVLVKTGSPLVGMTNKCEIQKGVIIAASLTRVVDGYATTSILITNETEVNVQEPLVRLDEVDLTWERDRCTEFDSQDREKNIQTQQTLEHINTEERMLLVQTCLDYQDMFYIPGDKLSSTDAARHTINVEPGTEPINT
jgi:hypothetical protein